MSQGEPSDQDADSAPDSLVPVTPVETADQTEPTTPSGIVVGADRAEVVSAVRPLAVPQRVPPGGRVFTLEGRSAPGLYLVAWVLSVAGLVLVLLVGPLATDDGARLLLVLVGAIVTMLGLAAACGYQVLARRDRAVQAYRGPSPLLVFGTYFFALAALGLVLARLGLLHADDPLGFLAIGSAQAFGYALVVWLMVVRTDALSWRDMGWPTWPGAGPVLSAAGLGALVMVPVTFLLLVAGSVIGWLLGVEAPDVLPSASDGAEALAVAAAAVIIIPITEELFFRGFALTAWLRDLGPRAALTRSAVFFALVHIANITSTTFTEGFAQAVLTTAIILPLAFVLGWLFLRRGMAAAIGGHVTYNGILLALVLLAGSLTGPQPGA